MKIKLTARFWARVMCWILVAMMVLGGSSYLIYAIAGLL